MKGKTAPKTRRVHGRTVLVECSHGSGGQHRLTLRYAHSPATWTLADLRRLLLRAFRTAVPKERRRHSRLFGVHYRIARFDNRTEVNATYGLGWGSDAAVYFTLPAGVPLRVLKELLTPNYRIELNGTMMLHRAPARQEAR